MKKVVSVSLGSATRDKTIILQIAGEEISVTRLGTNGNIDKAIEIISELDGTIDAFGLGGCDLGMLVNDKYFPMHSVKKIAGYARRTPLTDGAGLKNSLELKSAFYLDQKLGKVLSQLEKNVLLVNAVSRWGMAKSFMEAGYHCTYGDFMFSLGIPLPILSKKNILRAASVLCPVITRLPFSWIYPVGSSEGKNKPAYQSYFQSATVIAGDCLYIKQSIPPDLDGKIIVTNTTTKQDIELFKKCGISHVFTTTPVFDGRTFGTNVIEAIILAISGKRPPLSQEELDFWIKKLNLLPQIRQIN